MADGKICGVCKEAQSKYKCPSCLAPYCSVACFKKHKENPCSNISARHDDSASTKSASSASVFQPNAAPVDESRQSLASFPRPLEVTDPKWIIEKKYLLALAECGEIRKALEDQELRKLILQIDSAQEPLKDLKEARNIPMFSEFADKILDIVSPQ